MFLNILASGYIPVNPHDEPTGIFWEKPQVTYFWQGCNTTFMLSWDDARLYDINLAPIDEKYGISHTIFAPSYRSYPNRSYWRYSFLLDELLQGYDVQSHCGKHVHLSRYSSDEQESIIRWGKTGIEELFGFTPIVFAYPYGDTGGSKYVKKYFDLGRTIAYAGTSWPPSQWHLEGTTISCHGINDGNLECIVDIMEEIYRTSNFQVFKGYGHTNALGTSYGVSEFTKYEETIAEIANWPDVWYTSWGSLVAYEIEKNQIIISEAVFTNDKIEFEISAPSLDTGIYKVPITISILIPKDWNPFPQIAGKFSSQFSLKEFNDSKELFLDVVPQKESQKISIWRTSPYEDFISPKIENFIIETRTVNQNWNVTTPECQTYTFMRFDVTDELSNIHDVNASVHLLNGTEFTFSNMKNPTFWGNSTYGRIIWNSSIINYNVPQVMTTDVDYTLITVQDGFGNIRRRTICSHGFHNDEIIPGNEFLLRLPDKNPSSLNRLS